LSLILGINAFHPDAAACLLRDGNLVAAVAEERLGSRHKHVAGFPGRAIAEVLRMAGATIRDVNYVAIGNDSNANLGAKVAHVTANPIPSAKSVVGHFTRRRNMTSLREQIAKACDTDPNACRFRVFEVEHYLAHLASSFFAGPFDEAAGFSYEGSGDGDRKTFS